ncbi:MAG: TRAP transporter TatT component family protein [Gammaproteobacteria bacterium]
MAADLSASILDQEDPELVREAVPAFLLLLDSMVRSSPDNPATLGAAAELYAAYGIAFNDDPQRAKLLTYRARDYGRRALCADHRDACGIEALNFADYERAIGSVGADAAGSLYSYAVGSLAYIRAHSADYIALADLPKVETALKHLLDLDADGNTASVNMYLGILNTLRPPALGGHPEQGRAYFEAALSLAGDRDLSIKVEYARGYARLLYERELHDRLLNEVLAAEVRQSGYTLMNSLAQRQARELLASADDYF